MTKRNPRRIVMNTLYDDLTQLNNNWVVEYSDSKRLLRVNELGEAFASAGVRMLYRYPHLSDWVIIGIANTQPEAVDMCNYYAEQWRVSGIENDIDKILLDVNV